MNQKLMGKHIIQYFRHTTYRMWVFNMACASKYKCNCRLSYLGLLTTYAHGTVFIFLSQGPLQTNMEGSTLRKYFCILIFSQGRIFDLGCLN